MEVGGDICMYLAKRHQNSSLTKYMYAEYYPSTSTFLTIQILLMYQNSLLHKKFCTSKMPFSLLSKDVMSSDIQKRLKRIGLNCFCFIH